MDASSAATDPEYELARAKAEQQYYISSVTWEKKFLEEAQRSVAATKKDACKDSTGVVTAAWKGEPLPVKPEPSIDSEIVLELVRLSEDYITADLSAFSALLQRKDIAPSLAIRELERHATSILEEIRDRKWKRAFEAITTFFPGSSPLEEAWRFVKERAEEYLLDTLEPSWWGIDQEADQIVIQETAEEVALASADAIAAERQNILAQYKRRAHEKGIKVTDQMIAKAASPRWNTRTMVTWWKRNDARCKPPHDRLIRRALTKDPSATWPST